MELTAVAPTEEPTTAQLTAVAVATELTAAVPTEELTMAELKAELTAVALAAEVDADADGVAAVAPR